MLYIVTHDALLRLPCTCIFADVSEEFISQSAASDGDVDRIERMRVCEELWRKCNDKIQVNFCNISINSDSIF